jgi:hypothetical protein
MLNKQAILEYLKNEGLDEIDEIKYRDNVLVYNLFYSFDDPEKEAAKDYANENHSDEKSEDEWYNEHFLPYLIELATDNVKDILSDLCDEHGMEAEFVVYELDRENYDQLEFIIMFANEGTEIDVDSVLGDLDI